MDLEGNPQLIHAPVIEPRGMVVTILCAGAKILFKYI